MKTKRIVSLCDGIFAIVSRLKAISIWTAITIVAAVSLAFINPTISLSLTSALAEWCTLAHQ